MQVRTGLRPAIENALRLDADSDADFNIALEKIWELVRRTNKYMEETAPWRLRKDGEMVRFSAVLGHVAAAMKDISISLYPFIPETAIRIWKKLGLGEEKDLLAAGLDGIGPNGVDLTGAELGEEKALLFPRVEDWDKKEGDNSMESQEKDNGKKDRESNTDSPDTVSYEYFSKLDIRIAVILSAEKVKKTDRLVKLEIDLGSEKRQIIAGIAEAYPPESLPGRRIVVIANLEPAKIRGIESRGMLLAAVDGEKLELLTTEGEVSPGTRIS
jgi:methionyl-tRNA synthetase